MFSYKQSTIIRRDRLQSSGINNSSQRCKTPNDQNKSKSKMSNDSNNNPNNSNNNKNGNRQHYSLSKNINST